MGKLKAAVVLLTLLLLASCDKDNKQYRIKRIPNGVIQLVNWHKGLMIGDTTTYNNTELCVILPDSTLPVITADYPYTFDLPEEMSLVSTDSLRPDRMIVWRNGKVIHFGFTMK